MRDTLDTKISKSYSVDRDVVAWLQQKAAKMTVETGTYTSASQIANDILRKAMEKDQKPAK